MMPRRNILLRHAGLGALAAACALGSVGGHAVGQTPSGLRGAPSYVADDPAPVPASSERSDATLIITGGAVLFALTSLLWALRVSFTARTATVDWSRRLARLEAKFEISESILSSHPGLVIVWDDTVDDLEEGWGRPRVLGGSAALASLLTFAANDPTAFLNPAESLLGALGDLPLEGDENRATAETLAEKLKALREHGVTFSGAVVTEEGRSIEVDGRVAGTQVALWLTDPAARLAEESGVVGAARDKAADLHGALNQLDRSPVVAWRRSADLTIEWANRAYVEMVEAICLQEILDEQIEIHPDFRQVADNALDNVKQSVPRAADGIVTVNVKGKRKVYRVVETPMHSAGGASFGGMAIDITRQEQAREDLQRADAAHRRTLDQLSTAVAVFNSAQALVFHNQAFLQLWDFEEADLRARPSHGELLDRLRQAGKLPAQDDFQTFKHNQLRLYTEDLSESSFASEGATPDELWNLPDGRTLRVAQERHGNGGVSVVFEDQTETLRLQSKYQSNISSRSATLNSLAQGVSVFNTSGRLGLFNRAFEDMWSLTRDDVQGEPHFDDLCPKMVAAAQDAGDPLAELKGRIVSFAPEDRTQFSADEITLKDGRILQPASAPLPDGNTLITFLDITDAKGREKDLEIRNQILEDADRIKARFVDHISYQLRNPLNTILVSAQMLEGEIIGPMSDQQKDYATSVLTAGNDLLDLVNDIIDLAAIDAGRLGLDMTEIDVRALLEGAQTLATLKAEDSQIKLTVDCPKDIGDLLADERRLKQVLFNLLRNAFSYTEAGGEVTLGAARADDVIRIWVEDTGRGVSPEKQAKVFDRFESAGPGSGAGVGLALVNSFIELHGGFVRLKSQEGTGTVVTCHLPASGPAEGGLDGESGVMMTAVGDTPLLEALDGDEILAGEDEPEAAPNRLTAAE